MPSEFCDAVGELILSRSGTYPVRTLPLILLLDNTFFFIFLSSQAGSVRYQWTPLSSLVVHQPLGMFIKEGQTAIKLF